jgi:predicted ArsR family transcriptional regulator
MHSTKLEILAFLKRSDGATVDEMASSLGVAGMTVRQHLLALERDGAVRAETVRRPAGRPSFRYHLTDDGHRRLSDGYDRLVALLVEQAGSLEPIDLSSAAPQERQALLFRRAAVTLADRTRGEIFALEGAARVERIAGILRLHGGFADWHENGAGYELRDFNCVYRGCVGGGGACEWHGPFLRALLGQHVVSAPPPDDPCAECCRYMIPAEALAPTKGNA